MSCPRRELQSLAFHHGKKSSYYYIKVIFHLISFFIPDTMRKQITVIKLSAHVRHHEFTKNNGFVSEIETYSYYCEKFNFCFMTAIIIINVLAFSRSDENIYVLRLSKCQQTAVCLAD